MLEILFVVFGLIVGSFLSVCIYRIPIGRYDYPEEEDHLEVENERKAMSVMTPARSFCPKCQKTLAWWHNIPVVSWVLLRGRCQYCSAPIPKRYVLVECLSGLMSYLSFATFGVSPTGFIVYAFCAALIVISFIDFDFYIIPNLISLPGTAIGLGVALANDFFKIFYRPVAPGLYDSLLGIIAGAGFLYVISEGFLRLRGKEGLGLGDVKLLAMTGALFGWECSLCTIFIGSLAGSIIGLSLIAIFGRKFSQHLPFGPYLAIGTLFYLFNPELSPPLLSDAPIAMILNYFVG